MASADSGVILFHYEQSIYSHRILWYMHLRGIKYSECITAPYPPRPEISEDLGITYRRIPILAIGRDVYCDTRCILDALERTFPEKPIGGNTPGAQGIRKLFESYSINSGVFWRAATLLPMWRSAFLQDPGFIKDRSELTGRPFNAETLSKGRPEALAHIYAIFDLMETTFLADGRKWILGDGEGPSLADIDAVFPLQWIVRDPLMEGAVTEEQLSAAKFPRTFAWIDRFLAAVKDAEAKGPAKTTLSSKEAAAAILQSPPDAFDTQGLEDDPLDLTVGDSVTVATGDLPTTHVDTGVLVALTRSEICIVNSKRLRLHFPRWNFKIAAAAPTPPPEPAPAPSMHLIYHPMSPYSRKVYMLAHELRLTPRITLEEVVVAPTEYKGWSDDNDRVARANPLAKIPTLVPGDDADGIYDSRVIAAYLLSEAGVVPTRGGAGTDERWRLETLQACADGVLDAQVLLVYEEKIRAEEGLRFEKWVKGQTEKITRGLDRLEAEAGRSTLIVLKKDEVASAGEVAVAATLGFMDLVNRQWRDERPKLAEWFKAWEARESFVKTQPDVDWKSGEKKDLGFGAEAIAGAKQ